MTEGYLIDLGREAFMTTLFVAGPVLGLGMIVGLIISIIQAVTAVQEMTLTFVPKILAVMVAIALFGPWMLMVMLRFTYNLFTDLPGFTR